MRFSILGHMEVHDGVSLVDGPSANKVRTILATLLVRANTVVSVDTLIEELWGEIPPRSALCALRVYVSQLRKFLAAHDGTPPRCRLVTQPPGYRLEVDEGGLDVIDFEQLCAAGRKSWAEGSLELAAKYYQEALSLRRGPILGDLRMGPVLEGARLRLEETWLAALERRVDVDLQQGRHLDLVGELRELVTEHPHNERLGARLMIAMYRSGRTGDALRAYRALRDSHIEQLGVEPGHELQLVQQAVLAADNEALARTDLWTL
jgi:DNA-binding SARP family transcriptional activator